MKVTDDTVLVPITLQIRNRDITFKTKDGVAKGDVNILGRVSTIYRPGGADLRGHGGGVSSQQSCWRKTLDNASVYWKSLPLRPGRVPDRHCD